LKIIKKLERSIMKIPSLNKKRKRSLKKLKNTASLKRGKAKKNMKRKKKIELTLKYILKIH